MCFQTPASCRTWNAMGYPVSRRQAVTHGVGDPPSMVPPNLTEHGAQLLIPAGSGFPDHPCAGLPNCRTTSSCTPTLPFSAPPAGMSALTRSGAHAQELMTGRVLLQQDGGGPPPAAAADGGQQWSPPPADDLQEVEPSPPGGVLGSAPPDWQPSTPAAAPYAPPSARLTLCLVGE